MKYYYLKKWLRKLGLKDIVRFERIKREQVTFNFPLHFVGVCQEGNIDGYWWTIYHDRKITEEDIIHELLHIKYPTRTEKWIRNKTKELEER